MAQRIKGQEVELGVIVNNVSQSALNAIKSIDAEFMIDRKEEGYLGETADRFDEIFKGVSGKASFHFDSPDVFTVINTIIDRARRRVAGVTINIKATFNFPSGRRARLLFKDVSFANVPLKFGSREDYGSIDIDFACSDVTVIQA